MKTENECHPPLPTVRKRLGFTHGRAVITRLPIKDCHVSAGPAISCPPCSDLNDDVTECSCRDSPKHFKNKMTINENCLN